MLELAGLDEVADEGPPNGEMVKTGEALAADLEKLGPTFIKLGQVLSVRYDLLPAEYANALARLQDHVAPFPFEVVERTSTPSWGCGSLRRSPSSSRRRSPLPVWAGCIVLACATAVTLPSRSSAPESSRPSQRTWTHWRRSRTGSTHTTSSAARVICATSSTNFERACSESSTIAAKRKTDELFRGYLKQIHVGKIVFAMLEVASRHGLCLAPELGMLGRALLSLDQAGKILDPDFDPNEAIPEQRRGDHATAHGSR